MFVDPLRKSLSSRHPILSGEKIGLIFSNLSFIRSINGELFSKLSARVEKWSPTQQVGDIFVEMVISFASDIQRFQGDSLQYSYSSYVNNYDQALKTLSWCQQNESHFAHFLEV